MENKNSKNKIFSILLTVILLVVIFSISALIAVQSVKIKQKTSPPLPTVTPTQTPKATIDFEKICLENNGKWLEAFTECEGIKEEVCTRNRGIYEPCASACRHQSESQVCIQICVEVCDFKGAQQGGP